MNSILGHREFTTLDQITAYVKNSKNFNLEFENLSEAKALLIFQTSNQHTWLVATKTRLYCILDDIRKPLPHINWSMSRQKILDGPHLSIPITARDKSRTTGLVDFDPKHKNWLYTKYLFEGKSIVDSIESFIRESMSD